MQHVREDATGKETIRRAGLPQKTHLSIESGAIEQRDSPASTRSNVHQRYDEITQAHQASKETNRVGSSSIFLYSQTRFTRLAGNTSLLISATWEIEKQ